MTKWVSRRLLWLLAGTPIMVAVAIVAVYSVNVPVGDEWTVGQIFLSVHGGTTSVREVWGQANESRPFGGIGRRRRHG